MLSHSNIAALAFSKMPEIDERKLRICIAGNMLGRNAGFVTSQGQIAADLFSRDGHRVVSASSKLNRFSRLADVVRTLITNRNSIDIVMLEVYSGASTIFAQVASFFAKVFSLPMILVLHGGNLPQFARRRPRWTHAILKRGDVLVAPSPYLADEMSRYGYKVKVVPNVVDIERYPFQMRDSVRPKLIWMRSFHAIYNPHLALRVLSLLKKTYPDATLVMAGTDKGLENETRALASALGLEQSVRFAGFLEASGKEQEFAAADIYLNTNRIDNMPVSVIEACAMGLPVVSTNVGGISRLLTDGQTGLLVGDDNAQEMAAAVDRLIVDSKLAAHLSRNGRRLAERSSWTAVNEEWKALFKELLPATRRTG